MCLVCLRSSQGPGSWGCVNTGLHVELDRGPQKARPHPSSWKQRGLPYTAKGVMESRTLRGAVSPRLSGWVLSAVTHVFKRETHRGGDGRSRPCDQGGRDRWGAAPAKGCRRALKLGEARAPLPLSLCQEHSPADTGSLNFWPSLVGE